MQVNGSTHWLRWCRTCCCRRDLKNRSSVCHARRRLNNYIEELRKGESKNNARAKDVFFVALKKEQQTDSHHSTSRQCQKQYELMMMHYTQQVEEMWRVLATVSQCQVSLSWIRRKHHRTDGRWCERQRQLGHMEQTKTNSHASRTVANIWGEVCQDERQDKPQKPKPTTRGVR